MPAANTASSVPYTVQWYLDRFEQAKAEAHAMIEPIDDYIFTLRPEPETWSVAECYSHLLAFGDIYCENIRSGLDRSKPGQAGMSAAFPPRMVWKGVIKFFEPPYRIKMKTLRPFMPASGEELKKPDLLGEFEALQDRFKGLVGEAQEKSVDLNSVKVPNPILKMVKMTLSESFAVAEAHQRRHIWQARQIYKRLGGQNQES